MANEATLVVEIAPPIMFTVADGAGIEKGAILKMTDPMTAILADGDGDAVAGIAAEEKIASDGKTKLAVYREGIFKVQVGATGTTVGKGVMTYASTGDANDVVVVAAGEDDLLGVALETATNNETALIQLMPVSRDIA